jgi:hypothetical protein
MDHSPTSLSDPDLHFVLSLNLSDPKDCARYSAWLTEQDRKRGIRTASAGSFRAGITYDEPRKSASEWRDHFGQQVQGFGSVVTDTPDPYASATNAAPCPFDDANYSPHGAAPDGYAIGIANRQTKKETR